MTININFNSGLHNVDSFELNGNTEYGSYASFETEDPTFTLRNISCNGDIAESLTITDPNYSSYSDSISSKYDTFIISTAEGTYTIDVDSVFTSVFTVTASANDCDLGDVYVDDVSNRACSISEDITPHADYTLGSVSKLYCKFTQWSDGDENPIRQMTAGAGGNTLNYAAYFTYKFMNNWYINGTEYITFNSTTGMKRGTINNLTSLTYSFNLTTGIVTDSNNVTYQYDNTNDTFTVNGNTYTKTTNPQLKTLHIDLHDSGGSMQDYHGQGSIGIVNVTTPEDGTVQMYVVYGYDLKRSDYDFKIAPGQSITFTKVFAASTSITFTKTSGTCTYTSALLSDGLRIDFSDISTDCELRIVLPVNNAAGQNGDYVLDCGWNETGCTWDQGWDLTKAPLMGHGNMISDNYILGNRGCESGEYDASKMMYYCVEPKHVTTHIISLSCDSTKGTVGYSTDGGYNWTMGTNLTVTVNDGDNLQIRAEGLTGQYDFSAWSDGNNDDFRTLTNIQADATYSATFVTHVFENTMVFTGATVTGAYFDCDNGEGYVWYPATNNTIIFDDGDFWSMKKLTTANGDIVSSVDYSYPDGTAGTNTITNPEDQIAGHYEDPGTMNITINSTFPYAIPDLTGRRFGNVEGEESWYFTAQNAVHYKNGCGEGATSTDLNITAWLWDPNGYPQNCWNMQTDGGVGFYYDPAEDKFYDNHADYYPEISYDPCNPQPSYSVDIITSGQGTVDGIHSGDQTGQYYLTAIPAQGWVFDHWTISGWDTQDNPLDTSFPDAHQTVYVYFVQEGPGPQPTEKHIYLCDNSGAHLAEMTNTGSTWNVTGSFTSGMYSVRATVENEYNDAWFKFYQTQGDNRIFVGAGDDPNFEEIGTYILIDNILVSFSLVEDQETGYYVVTYQNTEAMTVSTVETIVNTYVGEMGFVTGSDIAAMSYITMTDIQNLGYIDQTALSSMSYITMADVSARSYVNIADLNAMSYVSQTALSAMGYVTAGEIPTPDLTNCVKYADLNVYAYVSQPALSAMSYVDNSYLSTYMNNVVGNIESILQTI